MAAMNVLYAGGMAVLLAVYLIRRHILPRKPLQPVMP
jgi:hypothetical protein